MTLVAMPNADEAQRTLSGLPDLYMALDHSSHRVLSYVPVLDGADRVLFPALILQSFNHILLHMCARSTMHVSRCMISIGVLRSSEYYTES